MAMTELEVALKAWRKTKHPRFATLVELAAARLQKTEPTDWEKTAKKRDPLQVSWLFATVGDGVKPVVGIERLARLATLNDPRVVSGVLALLEKPPWVTTTAKNFFRLCLQILEDAKDARVKPALESLEPRFKSIINSQLGGQIASWMRTTIKSYPEIALDESQAALADSLEASFAHELGLARRKKPAGEQGLLEAIYAAPDDDAPRLVYADALLERGDVHGELINLQIARARGPVSDDDVRREEALLASPENFAKWGLPLSSAGHVIIERGFPSKLLLEPREAKTAVASPALRLLTELRGLSEKVGITTRRALVNDPLLDGATRVESLDPKTIASLKQEAPWPSISLVDDQTPFELAALKNVERLEWRRFWRLDRFEPFNPPARFVGAFPRLTAFMLHDALGTLGAWLEGMEGLESFGLFDFTLGRHLKPNPKALAPLRTLTRLRRLELSSDADHRLLEGLTIEDLDAMHGDPAELMAALPSLRTLRLWGEGADSVVAALHPNLLGRLKTLEIAWLRFDDAFTPRGVARVTPHGVRHTHDDHQKLVTLLASLSTGCVQRIELNRFSPFYAALETQIRQHAQVPVVNRWQ